MFAFGGNYLVSREKMGKIKICAYPLLIESRHKNLSSGFLTRSNTKRAVQPQRMAKGLKFQI